MDKNFEMKILTQHWIDEKFKMKIYVLKEKFT